MYLFIDIFDQFVDILKSFTCIFKVKILAKSHDDMVGGVTQGLYKKISIIIRPN